MKRRLVLTGVLEFTAPWAIGAGEVTPDTDRPILLDCDGIPYLPATSLAGSLRSLLERLAPSVRALGITGADLIDELFGVALDNLEEQGNQGQPPPEDPSRPGVLRVHDAALVDDRLRPPVALRDGVGIDRVSGSVREGIKYDLEVAGHQARYQVTMEVDLDRLDTDTEQGCLALLRLGLHEWEQGRGVVGGRGGSGLGAFRLSGLTVRRVDLNRLETLRHWLYERPERGERHAPDGGLLGEQAELDLPDLEQLAAARTFTLGGKAGDDSWPGALRLDLTLDAVDPVLIGGLTPIPTRKDRKGRDAPDDPDPSGSDAQPLTRPMVGDTEHPEHVLPGSSLRGALRSRAERIVRTLGGRDFTAACDPLEDKDTPWKSCGRQKPDNAALENATPAERREHEPRLAKQLRAEATCPVCRVFGSTALGGRVRVEEGVFHFNRDQVKLMDHVAIDRFTGGAADAKKFDTAPLPGATTTTTIHLDRPEPWEVVLLLLTVRDLVEGWIPVGSRGSRGYGRVRGNLTRLELRTAADDDTNPLSELCTVQDGPWRLGVYDSRDFGGQEFLGRDRPWDLLDSLPAAAKQALETGHARLRQEAERWAQVRPIAKEEGA